jgi:selenocysteine lyase/cysteine desulfurase
MGVRGADDFSKLVEYDMTWRDDARRFEFVTLPFQEFVGLNASLELFFELGIDEVVARTESLVSHIDSWAAANRVRSLTPRDARHRAGIVALRVADAETKSAQLQDAGVSHSLREGAIRLAPYFLNTEEEIDRALQLLSS